MVRVRVLAWLSRLGRDPERELREFKKDFERASREKDRAALDRMMHPDFSMVTPDGDTVPKQGVIAGIVAPTSNFMPHYHRKERITSFTVSGNTAREIADLSIAGQIPGRGDLTGEYTHSAIFTRDGRGWQFRGNTLTRKTRVKTGEGRPSAPPQGSETHALQATRQERTTGLGAGPGDDDVHGRPELGNDQGAELEDIRRLR